MVERSWWNAAVALLIGLLYWWQLAGMLPVQEGQVSWEGHLCGFIGGVTAIVFRHRRPKPHRRTGRTLPDFTLPR